MMDEQLGATAAPTVPCEECAAATQRQVMVAVVIGVATGGALFFVLYRAGALSSHER